MFRARHSSRRRSGRIRSCRCSACAARHLTGPQIGCPGQKELAIGAIASGGIRILNRELIAALGVTEEEFAATIALYRGVLPGISVQGKITILVDDGIATGSSMLAAISALRSLQPKRIVVATPVVPLPARDHIRQAADEFVCLLEPQYFFGIGQFYDNFSQTEDSEVRDLLSRGSDSIAAMHAPEMEA